MRTGALVIIAGLGIGAVPLAAHGTGCTNASLKGAYGVIEKGGFPIPVITTNFDSVGIFNFDGAGHFTFDHTITYTDGTEGSEILQLTYTVTSNCKFSFAYSNGETFFGVIVNNGQGLIYAEDTPSSGVERTGQATKIRTE
jgi:hypothetical protein